MDEAAADAAAAEVALADPVAETVLVRMRG